MTILFFILAAVCNSIMDHLMIKYLLLEDRDRNKYYGWFTFDPLAKWKFREWGDERAYNVILLKIGIKTKLLSDNCNDAWHFFKSLMVIFLSLSAATSWYMFFILGVVWIIAFNVSYKKY